MTHSQSGFEPRLDEYRGHPMNRDEVLIWCDQVLFDRTGL